ncbi:HTH-type transcriptional activator IlvY [Geothermobacter hydrogeniphilus]|uniref:Transcriptional regulator IlvY n=1 Tax=Geothermobacter hydrogeniphilus TaxID=1969733 RepID=A0A1X0XL69_9BACT|nr:HTH-type transcriptional activator IlvY [Geothermobacter hydrogeniphilus]ORJ53672.1 transcriptional regulator IlvY [Geothermobacter hydrogeniphilus]
MDINELEIFLSVAEQLHFGRASQACNLSPSALTRTIQRLETQLGQTLFLRDNRSVALSATGERFRDYARKAVSDWYSFRDSLRTSDEVSGSLSLYASITAVYSLLPDLLEAYRQAYPEVHLELRTGAAEQALPQLQSGQIDVAVAALPDRLGPRIEFLPIATTPLIFIAPAVKTGNGAPNDIPSFRMADTPLVVPRGGQSRRRLDQWFKEQQLRPNISSEVSGNEAIIAMVRLGVGVGVVPQLVLERSPFRDEMRILEDAPRLEPYIVGLCTSRKNLRRPAVKAFWQLGEQGSG